MSLLDFGEDSPSSPPSNNAAPAQASGGNNDPFGNDPFGSNDPFGTDGSSAQDPFGGGEGVKASDDPFGASSGGDAFDPFSSPPPSSMDQKSPSSNPGAFDDFDPFSGPLLSPSAAPAQENKPAKDAFSFSDNDDLFGGGGGSDSTAVKSEVAASGESDFDPFGTDLLGGSEKTKEEEETPNKDEVEIPNEDEESKMSANGDKTSSLEAQFDDLMGDMNGSGEVTTMEVTRTETSSEVSSSQGEREGSPGLSDAAPAKKDMKAMEYMKARYEVDRDGVAQQPKIARQPKKLQNNWGKEGEEEGREAKDPPRKLPTEQDLLKYTSVGVDYTKLQYQDKASPSRSPSSPSRWNQSPKHIPPPVNRTIVEKVAPPEITKSVRALFEKGEFEDSHKPKKLVINLREGMDGGVFENNPVLMEGVVREADIGEDEQQAVLEKGHTKNMLDRFTRASQEERKPREPIKLDEGDGKIIESEPTRRDDVIRETDVLTEEPVLVKGSARTLRDRFSNIQEAPKERKVIKLYEDDQAQPVIVENQPEEVNPDVVRSLESEVREVDIAKGSAKNLQGFWSTCGQEKMIERAPIQIDRESDGIVLESNPVQRDDVIRETDVSESDAQIQLESGRTHNMRNMWQGKYDEENDPERYNKTPKKQPIKLDVAPEGTIILENEPTVRDDVVRGDPVEEVIQVKKGHARNIAGAFVPKQEEQRTGPREMIKIDRSEGPEVIENQPEEYAGDVVRGGFDTTIHVDPGKCKNMVNQWRTKQEEDANPKERESKPFWLQEMEAAKANAGVYENEPEVREDLLKEDMDPLEHQTIIPQGQGQNMKALWAAKMEEEEQKNKPLEVISRKKKKEPPPPPPPKPKPKPPSPEPKKRWGRKGAPTPVSTKVVSPYGVSLKNTKTILKNEKDDGEDSPPALDKGAPKLKSSGAPGKGLKSGGPPRSLHSAPAVVEDNPIGGKFPLRSTGKSSRSLLRK